MTANRKRLFRMIAATAIVLCLALTGFTVAFMIGTSGDLINVFSPADFKVEIEEKFDPDPPGDTAVKSVMVENKGSTDAFVRVAIVPTFRKDAGESYAGTVDYSTVGSGFITVTAPDGETKYQLTLNSQWTATWFFQNGVFYHIAPLPGNTLSKELLASVSRVSGEAESRFSDMEIEVLLDAVQTEGTVEDAIRNWDAVIVNGNLAAKP